jgi:DNA ligase-1
MDTPADTYKYILYNTSRATGRTKVWSVEVQGDVVSVKHGALDGKQVVHETICKAKKSKDAHQVAMDYAQSLWDKKRKIGYDTTQGVTRQGYFPMLAQEYTPGDPLAMPCLVQPKLDGIRCLIYRDSDGLIFQSRNQTHFQDFPHLIKALTPFFETNPDVILDGELYHHDMDFQTITSMVRRKGHPDLGKIEYHVYDCITPLPYQERYAFLQKIHVDKVVVVEASKIQRVSQIETYHTAFAELGYEGIMIRNPQSLYQEQIRSKDLLKYKLFKEQEYQVIGHVEGKGGIPVFVCETNGKTFQVMVKSTMEDKKNTLEQVTSFYHQWLTVKYQELSKDGIPRFPVGIGFRDGT